METFYIHQTTLEILLTEPQPATGAKGGSAMPASGTLRAGNDAALLRLAQGYRVALARASERRQDCVAFPCIDSQMGSGPHRDAAQVATQAVRDFLAANPKTSLRRVVFMESSREAYDAFCDALKELSGPSSP